MKMTDEQMQDMAPGEYTDWEKRVWRRGYEAASSAPQPPSGGEVVAWHVVDEHDGLIADCTDEASAREVASRWEYRGSRVRPLVYGDTAPPSAPVGVPADILRIVDTAIDVCSDRDRPAMAEDLEAVRLYVEQASAALAQQPAAVDGAMDKARFKTAPCYLCGYNGPGYYQPDAHPCAAKYHAAQQPVAVYQCPRCATSMEVDPTAKAAAVDGAMVRLAKEARELQRKHYGDGCGLHLSMIDWAKKFDALAAQPGGE